MFSLLIVGFVIESTERMPPNAIVYVDVKTKNYFGEPTALDKMYLGHKLSRTTLRNAWDKDYKPEETSRNRGDFIGYDRSLIVACLAKIGFLPEIKRWNSDGTWNY